MYQTDKNHLKIPHGLKDTFTWIRSRCEIADRYFHLQKLIELYAYHGKIELQVNGIILESEVQAMCNEKELSFCIFVLYSLADKWKKTPATVYEILNTTGILDNYIIPCYDVLHTQGKEYLVEDITEFVKEKGVIL